MLNAPKLAPAATARSVRRTAPVVGDGVGEVLAVGRRAGELRHEDDKALFGPEAQVPACGPAVTLS
jgi:hypothetical protein